MRERNVWMITPEGIEESIPEDWVSDALECGYSIDSRAASEYLADKAARGYSMAMDMMGCEL